VGSLKPVPATLPVKSKFEADLFGFVEFDAIHDTTQSFVDLAGNTIIQPTTNYRGNHQQTIFGVRNSRLGFKFKGPDLSWMKTSALLEMDFLGNQPGTPPTTAVSEAAFFTNPAFRIRHYMVKMETPIVDVLAGQYWQLFGWQSYFHPNTVEIQGVPGQIYSRSPQFRLSHTFKTSPVNIDIAAAAARPPQRDSSTPDFQGGVRLVVNDWKAVHTTGAASTAVDPGGIGFSGVYRHFQLPQLVANPSVSNTINGGGFSVDALLPVIPADGGTRGNSLTLNADYVRGTGIADFYTNLNGGITFFTPMGAAATFVPDLDNGLVIYDAGGILHTVDWWSVFVGLQYYFPPNGQFWISGNWSMMKSDNIADLAVDAMGNPARGSVFNESMWADGNLFYDVSKAVRVGGEFAWFHQTRGNDAEYHNYRGQISIFYIF